MTDHAFLDSDDLTALPDSARRVAPRCASAVTRDGS